ncbi:MAG TPA: hypothetical protein VJY15_17775 [Candidatus Acidoferrum sp.]|nr:hypothetical protein [Candidatus Acidoferrum sp.]
MSDGTERTTIVQEGQSRWIIPTVGLVAILAVIALVVGWKGLSYAQESRQASNNDIQTVKQACTGYTKNVELLQQRLAQDEKTNADLLGSLSVLTKRVKVTQAQLQKVRQEAQDEAQQIRDESNRQIAAMGNTVNSELSTKANNDDVQAVSGQVAVVRNDLISTDRELQRVRGEVGALFIGGHLAVDALLWLGERDYIDFTIAAKDKPQRVGEVTIQLKGVNPKKNQFSLALVVDDKHTERRNVTINEPIFFYSHDTRRPVEIVINHVDKNKVTGYLGVPKTSERASTSSGGN